MLSVGSLNKGLGFTGSDLTEHAGTPEAVRMLGWNLLREELSLPSAVLYQERLLHNLEWMRAFTAAYGVRLAPHGKTTMAPRLFEMQLQAGAWGITVATAHQARVAFTHGVGRVLMANQLVGRPNMAIIAPMLRDPGFDFYCLVDSAAQVDQLSEYLRPLGLRLKVLIELGVDGGRGGVRDAGQLAAVLDALDRHREAIALAGVEVYEGVLGDEAAIRGFLARAVEVTRELIAEGRLPGRPILTGAGSAWFDVVAEVFTGAGFGSSVEIVLRPGCYLTHDAGSYRRALERMQRTNSVAAGLRPGLQTALHLWAYVQSVPEPHRAIVGMGRRDAAFDAGLPVPALHLRPGRQSPAPVPPHWTVSKMMDQHAYLEINPADDIRVGDMLAFDICHPCLTFDKWRTLPVVDSRYQVIDIVQTFF